MRQTNDRLRESEAAVRSLFRAAPIGLAILANRRIRLVNDCLNEMFGYRSGELVGQPTRILYPSAAEHQRVGGALYANVGAARLASVEARMLRKDGAIRDVVLTAAPLEPGNPSAGFAATAQDITDRKKNDETQRLLEHQLRHAQKMETVGRIAAGVAHDLNNLLTPILGYSELAAIRLAPEEMAGLGLDEIREAARRTREVTRQLLAFTRKQPIEVKTLNLSDLVAQFLKLLRQSVRDDVRIETRLNPSVGAVRGDRTQLQQVLLNLVVNANDAMPDGGTLTITVDEVERGNASAGESADAAPARCVRLTVQDTGCGMDEALQRRLFEPFFTTKPEGQGTGLGLATCHGIAKQHGGYIRVDSVPNRGSTFAIYLPCVEGAAAVDEAPMLTRGPRGGETVLVVDDARTVRNLLRSMLRALGYEAIEAATPDEAAYIARSHQGPIHLLLTDVVLPGRNGRQLYQIMRVTRETLRVLYISGYTDDVIAPHGLLEPGIHFLAKPFTVTALAEKVREALDSEP